MKKVRQKLLLLFLVLVLVNVVACSNKQKNVVTVYMIDNQSGEIITKQTKCDEVDEQEIWKLLKTEGVVCEKSKVNFIKKEGSQLLLDINYAFGEQLRSQGTNGEEVLMTCVVNTYLDAYNCEKIKITEENQTLYSGHAEYDGYMEKYEKGEKE